MCIYKIFQKVIAFFFLSGNFIQYSFSFHKKWNKHSDINLEIVFHVINVYGGLGMQNFNAVNSTCSINLNIFWKEASCHLPEFLKALELSEIPFHGRQKTWCSERTLT